MRLENIFKRGLGDPDFWLHIFSSWVNMRLHTKNQLPGLPGSTLKVSVMVGWRLVQADYVVTPNLS